MTKSKPQTDEQINTLQKWTDEAEDIVFFGGAGVSTESGLPDFRGENGLYKQKFKYPPEYMLSRSFFDSHTEEFFEFYRAQMLPTGILPNAAHYKLAEMERAEKLSAVITQNIDGLHQMAGSKNVYELHGSVHRNRCMSCGRFYPLTAIENSSGIPRCECGGIIKPEVVLYEEPLPEEAWNGSIAALENADLLIIAGTSLTVYPAAYLVQNFGGRRKIIIDPAAACSGSENILCIRKKVGETLSQIKI